MFDVAVYTTESDAVDWRELADQVFPDEVLRQAPAVNRLVFMKVQIPLTNRSARLQSRVCDAGGALS